MGVETTWVIVPAFNEADAIGAVVDSVLACGYQVVVVDDASTDGTSKALRSRPVHLLTHVENLGQGAALQTGITYALLQGAEYLVTFDADGQHCVAEIEKLLEPLRTGSADIALGTRFSGGGEAVNIPPLRRRMLSVATFFTRLTTGLKLTDTHNGFRAMTAESARKFEITLNRMAHASQLLRQIAQQHLRYVEVPVHVLYTDYSLQKGQRISNVFNIVWESLMELFRI